METLIWSEETLAETDQKLGIITLNRPAKRNAISQEMIAELHELLSQCEGRTDLGALVIHGAGDRAFAAGADIAQLRERNAVAALARINAALFRRIEEHPLPVIAAVEGYALGGGCELAMACDIRIAGRTARFGQPEVGLGIIPGAGAIQRLPKLVGLGRAKELIFSGALIDAEEAERIGLVNRVVDAGSALDAAKTLAGTIAQQGAVAVRVAKLALNASARSNAAFDTLDALGQAVLFDSKDKYDRMTAFLEARNARAGGRS